MNTLLHFLLLLCQSCHCLRSVSFGGRILGLIKVLITVGWVWWRHQRGPLFGLASGPPNLKLTTAPDLCLDHTFILSCYVQYVLSYTPSGPCSSRLDNHTFSPAMTTHRTSFPTPGMPGEWWLGNPTWTCWATAWPGQCSCLCSWTPGCWNATVEWSLSVLLTSPRFVFCAAFFSLPITALLS